MRKLIVAIALAAAWVPAHSQVLISLLFGDKLNSGKVEFGLDGGLNFTSMGGLPGSRAKTNFNIGFYFDIKTKNPKWLISTGVLVKASLGAAGLKPYSLNDPHLDSVFTGGEVWRKINYFNVPIGVKYKLSNSFYLQGAVMPSLRSTAHDIFTNDRNGEVEYKRDIGDQIARLDFGLLAGAGYRLMKGNGMNFTVRYYYGLANVNTDHTSPGQYNQSLYLAVGIPIGAGKAREREAQKKQ